MQRASAIAESVRGSGHSCRGAVAGQRAENSGSEGWASKRCGRKGRDELAPADCPARCECEDCSCPELELELEPSAAAARDGNEAASGVTTPGACIDTGTGSTLCTSTEIADSASSGSLAAAAAATTA